MVEVEEALASALADRLGVDLRVDPRPRLFVAAALAALRAAFAWWEETGRSPSQPIAGLLSAALGHTVYDPDNT